MKSCFASAVAGDPVATRRVVESLRPRIQKMALYYARCTGEDADDLLQEAWVGLLDALPTLDLNIGQPEHFLVQRARWRMLDAVKRAHVRKCEPLDDTVEDVPCHRSPAQPLGDACVLDFLETLKGTQRAILRGLLEGLTWREVGDALGCTSANVAYHMRQIRARYVAWAGEAA